MNLIMALKGCCCPKQSSEASLQESLVDEIESQRSSHSDCGEVESGRVRISKWTSRLTFKSFRDSIRPVDQFEKGFQLQEFIVPDSLSTDFTLNLSFPPSDLRLSQADLLIFSHRITTLLLRFKELELQSEQESKFLCEKEGVKASSYVNFLKRNVYKAQFQTKSNWNQILLLFRSVEGQRKLWGCQRLVLLSQDPFLLQGWSVTIDLDLQFTVCQRTQQEPNKKYLVQSEKEDKFLRGIILTQDQTMRSAVFLWQSKLLFSVEEFLEGVVRFRERLDRLSAQITHF